MPKLTRAIFYRNGLIVQTKESAVHYRISQKPCGPDKNGYYFYAITRIDAVTRKSLGKKQRKSLGTKNREKAKTLLKGIQMDLQERTPENGKELFLRDFIREYHTSEQVRIRSGNIKEKTHRENMRYLEKFAVFVERLFGGSSVYLSEIKPDQARKFLESLAGNREGQNGNRARQYARTVLLRAFETPLIERRIKENPFALTYKIRVRHKEPNPFTPEELKLLVSRMPVKTFEQRTARNAIRFTYNTGLRNSELRNVRLRDIQEFADRKVAVYLPITKNRTEHTVPITNEALSAYNDQLDNLKNHFGKDSRDLPLFPNKNGSVILVTTVSKWVSKAIKRYNPDLKGKTFHCLRKTALDEVDKISGIKTASEIGNHSDTNVTKRYYTRKRKHDLKEHAAALEQLPRLTSQNATGKKGQISLHPPPKIPKNLLEFNHQIN